VLGDQPPDRPKLYVLARLSPRSARTHDENSFLSRPAPRSLVLHALGLVLDALGLVAPFRRRTRTYSPEVHLRQGKAPAVGGYAAGQTSPPREIQGRTGRHDGARGATTPADTPLSWRGSAWRAVSDPTVRFTYAVNPMMVGNLADTPFDGQSAILERGRRGAGCHYIRNRAFVPSEDDPALRADAGAKPEFLALAPWVSPDAARSVLRRIDAAVAAGAADHRYVETALIADLTFPADRHRPGCVVAGR
jgi:hypothetical protein